MVSTTCRYRNKGVCYAMTKQEILERLEIIKDSLSDCKGGGMDGFGIEGTVEDIDDLMWQINVNMKEI